ncbi:MAG: hypothetical protein ACRD36_06335, partial [Candidatus Acidiferrum sp.]
SMVNQLRQQAGQLVSLSDQLTRKETLLVDQQALIKRRELDVMRYQEDLRAMSKETASRLAGLRGMSDELYNVRVKTRDASERNQKTEGKIRMLEEGR